MSFDDKLENSTIRLGRSATRPRLKTTHQQLRVVAGPDRGLTVRFEEGEVRVGKGRDNALRLTDPAVSRGHVALAPEAGSARLKDLGSTNGTFVNDLRVTETLIAPGATFKLGATTVVFEEVASEIPVLDYKGASFRGLIGKSAAMTDLFAYLSAIAPTPLSVVIQGETGSGKELVAAAIHEGSNRAKGPFQVFDCGATDPNLIGSALFGHVSGAYTGATESRRGAFQAAHGGTLFLDEIGELPLELQPRLLRALERRTVQPLGSDTYQSVDVRVVCATHRDLAELVREGKFRQDLLYRLAGVIILIPALRERLADVVPLAEAFLRESKPGCTLSPEAAAVLEAHDWPGNVRELKNVVDRAAALAKGTELTAADVHLGPLGMRKSAAAAAPTALSSTLEQVEAANIRRALEKAKGNKSEAARILGIARKTLREKMERLGISSPGAD